MYPLNHNDIQQYKEVFHYLYRNLNNFDCTKITDDITISHIVITILLLSLSPIENPTKHCELTHSNHMHFLAEALVTVAVKDGSQIFHSHLHTIYASNLIVNLNCFVLYLVQWQYLTVIQMT